MKYEPAGASDSWVKAKSEWRNKQNLAKDQMRASRSAPGQRRALVEVAAQHPLKDGREPGPEFEARLQGGANLYHSLSSAGVSVSVYVPGSRHKEGDAVDMVPLSESGTTYLQSIGLPPESLHGQDLNLKYKGKDGVYGSADECYVASKFFLDGGFHEMHSIVSPSQLMRKVLHYIEFGVLPLMHSIPLDAMYHDYLDELFEKIPNVLVADASLQAPDSAEAAELRRRRRVD